MADTPSPADPDARRRLLELNTGKSHPARIWNYWLGGKDNYLVDREIGDQFVKIFPGIVEIARAERAFLVRTVSYLAREAGIRQFLDIGTGLPTLNNTHEVAQTVAPKSRIVYVDNDPIVLAHAQALLVGEPEGATDYIEADLRDPAGILRQAAHKLDLNEPVGLMLLGILGFLESDEVYEIVDRLVEALPSGSFLTLCDGVNVLDDSEAYERATDFWNGVGTTAYHLRGFDEIVRFFHGVDLVEPGVVSVPLWRPDAVDLGAPEAVNLFGGVGRKR